MDTRPKYEHVADRIRLLVRERRLRPGDSLPNERELSRMLGVSYVTVRKANRELVEAGLIRREHGRGTFVNAPARNARATWTIGFLAVRGELSGATLRNYRTMRAMLAERGHRLVFDSTLPSREGTSISTLFGGKPPDGLILHGFLDEAYVGAMARVPFPVVVSGNAPLNAAVSSVHYGSEALGYRLTRTLIDALGFEVVWLAIEPMRLFYSRQFVDGFRRALRDVPKATGFLSLCDDGDYGPFVRSFSDWRQRSDQTCAVIWGYDFAFADPALLRIGGKGRVTQVVSVPARREGWSLPPPADLGCIDYPSRLLMQYTVDGIMRLLDHPGSTPQHVALEPTLSVTERGTCHARLEATWHPINETPTSHSA
jgi:DNA-binding LacI/PurR family transcriptional regulator